MLRHVRRGRRALIAVALAVAVVLGGGTATLAAGYVPPPGTDPATLPWATDQVVVPMAFPVVGPVRWTDTFLACRGTGCSRPHLGQDVMGTKMQPLVATFDGTITFLSRTSSSGVYVSLRSADQRWTVNYLHVNNDTPGTDDGQGVRDYSFVPGLAVGSKVVRGQHLGWLGDSGNAEDTGPHLHVELRVGDAWKGKAITIAPSLSAAQVLTPAQVVRLVAPPERRHEPVGALDATDRVARDRVLVRGWASDRDAAPVRVRLTVDGKAERTLDAAQARPDVARALGLASSAVGFSAELTLRDGKHRVCALALDDGGLDPVPLGCGEVELGDRAPQGGLELVAGVVDQGVSVQGYAYDPDTPQETVDVVVRPDRGAPLVLTTGRSRPDVAVAPLSGFGGLVPVPPGPVGVCVSVRVPGGGADAPLGCRSVDVPSTTLDGTPRRARAAG